MDFYIHPAFKEKTESPTTNKFANTNKPSETLKESAMRVLSLIEINPQITAAEIAIKLGISSRAAQKHIANLKALSMINRIGSDKSGYWVITKW